MWKLANIMFIPKPNQTNTLGISYMPILLLSTLIETLEKTVLQYITNNISRITKPHGYKLNITRDTVSHSTIVKGLN